MDLWDKKKRSAVMAKIRSKDTKPELIVRRYLWSRGYRYRKNVRGLPGTPDIVLRKYGVVIFVHGCFWHGHEVDGTMPHTHTEFWRKKIERNKERDEKSKRALMWMGWMVITIWECQLKPKIRENTLMELEYVINHAYLERLRKKNVKSYRQEENEHSSGMAAEGVTEYQNEFCSFSISIQDSSKFSEFKIASLVSRGGCLILNFNALSGTIVWMVN